MYVCGWRGGGGSGRGGGCRGGSGQLGRAYRVSASSAFTFHVSFGVRVGKERKKGVRRK